MALTEFWFRRPGTFETSAGCSIENGAWRAGPVVGLPLGAGCAVSPVQPSPTVYSRELRRVTNESVPTYTHELSIS